MPKFEGCVEAKEISLCPVKRGGGANQHAHALVRKNNADPAPGGPHPKPEKTPMSVVLTDAEKAAARQAEINKAARAVANKIAGMSDVTKAYYLALDDDKQEAFLEKSAEDMAKDAETAKAAADQKKLEEEAAKSGVTPQVMELQKSNTDLRSEIDVLKADKVERDLEKRADTDFAGYPGGSAAIIPLLKAYANLDEPSRLASEAVLKSQCKVATGLTAALGQRVEEYAKSAGAAQARIDAAVAKHMEEHKVSKAKAYEAVVESPEFAEDVAIIG